MATQSYALLLESEAERIFKQKRQNMLALSSKPPKALLKDTKKLLQHYILLNVYCLKHNPNLIALIDISNQENKLYMELYLNSLKCVAQIYQGNLQKQSQIKQVYKTFQHNLDFKLLLKNRQDLVPVFVKNELQNINKDQVLIFNKKINSEEKELKTGYASIICFCSQYILKQSHMQSDQFWNKLVILISNNHLNGLQVMDLVINKLIRNISELNLKNILQKFKNMLTEEIFLEHLYKNYKQIDENKKLKSINFIQNKDNKNIHALALLIKHSIINLKQIFQKSSTQIFSINQHIISEMNIQLSSLNNSFSVHSNPIQKQFSEYRILELMSQLLRVNDWQHFVKVCKKFSFNSSFIQYIDHPKLFLTLSQLLEWIIDPFYRKISYSRHFKKRIQIAQFPKGYFTQFQHLQPNLLTIIQKVLKVQKILLFFRKSTFIKFCRLLTYIWKNQQHTLKLTQSNFIALIIYDFLLPSFQLYSYQPDICLELDKLLNCFNYRMQKNILNFYLQKNNKNHYYLLNNFLESKTKLQKQLLAKKELTIFNQIENFFKSQNISPLFILQFLSNNQLNYEILRHVQSFLIKLCPIYKKLSIAYLFNFLYKIVSSNQVYSSSESKKIQMLENLLSKLIINQTKKMGSICRAISYCIYRINLSNQKNSLIVKGNQCLGQLNLLSKIFNHQTTKYNNILQDYPNYRFLEQNNRLFQIDHKKNRQQVRIFHAINNLGQALLSYLNEKQQKKEIQISKTLFFQIIKGYSWKKQKITRDFRQENIEILGSSLDYLFKDMKKLFQIVRCILDQKNIVFFTKQNFCLLLQAQIPIEICFLLLRLGIKIQISNKGYSFFQSDQWIDIKNQIKKVFQTDLQKSYIQKSKLLSKQLSSVFKFNTQFILSQDIFAFFWILDQSTIILQDESKNSTKDLSSSLETQVHNQPIQFLQNRQINKLSDNFFNLHVKQNQNSLQIRDFNRWFIVKCIYPRALMSITQASYCLDFYFRYLGKNIDFPIGTKIQMCFQLIRYVVSNIPYATPGQIYTIMPFIFSKIMKIFERWMNFSQFKQNLIDNKIIMSNDNISTKQKINIKVALFSEQKKIVKELTSMYSNINQIQNCLTFIEKFSTKMLFKDHQEQLIDYFEFLKKNKLSAQIKQRIFDLQQQIRYHNKQGWFLGSRLMQIYNKQTKKVGKQDELIQNFTQNQSNLRPSTVKTNRSQFNQKIADIYPNLSFSQQISIKSLTGAEQISQDQLKMIEASQLRQSMIQCFQKTKISKFLKSKTSSQEMKQANKDKVRKP